MRQGWSYEPGLTKASFLTRLALNNVHIIIGRSFTRRGESTEVVGWQELLFLFSLVEHHPIHLGYVLEDLITHQGQHVCLGTIFVDSYITQLIRGMGLGDRLGDRVQG